MAQPYDSPNTPTKKGRVTSEPDTLARSLNGHSHQPRVTGWLVIDISSHIDQYGFVTRDGEMHAWRTMAQAPEGVSIRFRIGELRALASGNLIFNLTEAGILTAREIEVEGSNPDGVTAMLTALRGFRALSNGAAA